MSVIHKYELKFDVGEIQEIVIPGFHRCLSVLNQNGKMIVYVERATGPYYFDSKVKFRVVGTGWDYPLEPNNFIGTVQIDGFVWHAFHVMPINQ